MACSVGLDESEERAAQLWEVRLGLESILRGLEEYGCVDDIVAGILASALGWVDAQFTVASEALERTAVGR